MNSEYLGVPFAVMDCWALVRDYYEKRGVFLPAVPDADTYKLVTPIDEPIADSLLVFSIERECDHVGVYLGHNRMLHTTEQTGGIIHPLSYYRRWLVGVYKVVK